jgi:hypothetical protein
LSGRIPVGSYQCLPFPSPLLFSPSLPFSNPEVVSC